MTWSTVASVLQLGIDLAPDVLTLNRFLVDHRPAIDELGQQAPALWDRLKSQTQQRRAALQAAVKSGDPTL